jgi:hypothetical protein
VDQLVQPIKFQILLFRKRQLLSSISKACLSSFILQKSVILSWSIQFLGRETSRSLGGFSAKHCWHFHPRLSLELCVTNSPCFTFLWFRKYGTLSKQKSHSILRMFSKVVILMSSMQQSFKVGHLPSKNSLIHSWTQCASTCTIFVPGRSRFAFHWFPLSYTVEEVCFWQPNTAIQYFFSSSNFYICLHAVTVQCVRSSLCVDVTERPYEQF